MKSFEYNKFNVSIKENEHSFIAIARKYIYKKESGEIIDEMALAVFPSLRNQSKFELPYAPEYFVIEQKAYSEEFVIEFIKRDIDYFCDEKNDREKVIFDGCMIRYK